ncbi:hypothetical protein HDU93_003997 [Gonapodya sp. JEL0774]|nr:hypothetical protein HDU93_003997 [Gonapodya sp. JEL0774]
MTRVRSFPILHHLPALFLLAFVFSITFAPRLVRADPFTYRFQPQERRCFYVHSEAANEKIAFYFAVQSGGNFDIDYEVKHADFPHPIVGGKDEQQGDFAFSSPAVGEIAACFFNSASTFDSKDVTVELITESEQNKKQANSKQNKPNNNQAQTSVEASVANIGSSLVSMHRNQLHLRSRDNRNFSTVQSTESRIFWFALFQTLLIIGMAGLQVTIVRGFFK